MKLLAMNLRAVNLQAIKLQAVKLQAVKLQAVKLQAVKTVLAAVFLALLMALLLSIPARAASTDDLAELLEDYADADRRLYPSAAMGRGEETSPETYEEDLTAAHLAERRRVNEDQRLRLAQIDRGDLSPQDQLTYDIFAWTLEDEREALMPGVAEAFQFLPMDQFFGPHLSFAREMAWRTEYPLTRARDYDRMIRRMGRFALWIDQAIVNMREGLRRGITLPRIVVMRMIPELEPLAQADLESSLFLGPLREMPDTIGGQDRPRIDTDYRAAVAGSVIPAYARLHEFLKDEYLPATRAHVGLSAIPEGRTLYLHLVRAQTTQELSPDTIHALGLAEVARINGEMEQAKNEAGFSGSLGEFRAFLRRDPRFQFPDETALLAAFERVRDQSLARIGDLFETLPRARLEFHPLESFASSSKAAAEYTPPSANGARPGIVYFNSYDLPARPTYTIEALALHEGLPGHHLQIALSVENRLLPGIRRTGGFTAYVEGWAFYAESLGQELGFYDDPYTRFGQLSFEAWRAARLVIDTGIHWLGWTREEGIAYLLAHTSLSETDATVEVERYIALPGQALAYMIGRKKFGELRERAEQELGAAFDIRQFHDALLRDGAMPLPVLDAKIERWIAAEKEQ